MERSSRRNFMRASSLGLAAGAVAVRGDLLVRIDDKEIADLDAFREVVEALSQGKPEEVVFFIERGKESYFFAVKPEWE